MRQVSPPEQIFEGEAAGSLGPTHNEGQCPHQCWWSREGGLASAGVMVPTAPLQLFAHPVAAGASASGSCDRTSYRGPCMTYQCHAVAASAHHAKLRPLKQSAVHGLPLHASSHSHDPLSFCGRSVMALSSNSLSAYQAFCPSPQHWFHGIIKECHHRDCHHSRVSSAAAEGDHHPTVDAEWLPVSRKPTDPHIDSWSTFGLLWSCHQSVKQFPVRISLHKLHSQNCMSQMSQSMLDPQNDWCRSHKGSHLALLVELFSKQAKSMLTIGWVTPNGWFRSHVRGHSVLLVELLSKPSSSCGGAGQQSG